MWVALEWVERHCVIPDGFHRGEPFRLYNYQGLYLREFYKVRGDARWVPENPIKAPAFVHRRGLLIGPQKIGKNPLVAAQCCLEFIGPALFGGWAGKDDGWSCRERGCSCGWEYAYEPGEPMGLQWPTPKIQITAFSEDSTENTYDALRPMISQGPLASVLTARGVEFIRHPSGAEDARIDTVTSSNQSRLGARATFVPQDELGLWTALNKMVKLADTQYRNLAGMGGRASLTSNAWDPAEDSVAQREYESKATDVYRQFFQPPKNLSFRNKAERRKIYAIVYPLDVRTEGGGHVDLDSIDAEATDLAEKDANQAERFFGNRLVMGIGRVFETDIWDQYVRKEPYEAIEVEGHTIFAPPRGTVCGLGFDGSIYHDDTWLRGCTNEGYRFTIGEWHRPKGRDMLQWQKDHPGQEWQVPRDEVKALVSWARGYLYVGKLLADPPRWYDEILDWQLEFGKGTDNKPVVLAFDTNQPQRMAPAVDRWRTSIAKGELTHDDDREVARQVKNAHLKKVKLQDDDDADSTAYVVVKGPEKVPIDAAVADILAYEASQVMPKRYRSYYEDAEE